MNPNRMYPVIVDQKKKTKLKHDPSLSPSPSLKPETLDPFMKHPRNTKIDDNHPRRLLHRLLCCGPSPAPLRILLAATTDAPPCGHHRLLRPLSNLAHHHLLRPPPCDPNSCASDILYHSAWTQMFRTSSMSIYFKKQFNMKNHLYKTTINNVNIF
ncbi:hypothetical protein QJS10_CPB17g00778 [Acorus calamus]|uniref:Uncharacterized protein n=1 Tax=Acorus calamus TaxID=4465 RepID=A0AAV9CTM8_ACOCL|nr:hypothetical protein QJS10_CPB17g00778 [Acorus calamus]